jgi:hypothetical protein
MCINSIGTLDRCLKFQYFIVQTFTERGGESAWRKGWGVGERTERERERERERVRESQNE